MFHCSVGLVLVLQVFAAECRMKLILVWRFKCGELGMHERGESSQVLHGEIQPSLWRSLTPIGSHTPYSLNSVRRSAEYRFYRELPSALSERLGLWGKIVARQLFFVTSSRQWECAVAEYRSKPFPRIPNRRITMELSCGRRL
jgi:hypothetical protein